jgi:phenylpropionate dioxygenase-like ring-hydroxylating dioxygenase large terminal subunit
VARDGLSETGSTFSVAASEYVDADLYRREMAALRRRPLPLLPADTLGPGTRVLKERMGVSLIVARDPDGRLHVLKNRCRHRGAALTDEPCGPAQRLVCPYHGWSYDLDGRILHVPEREGFPGLDDAAASLHRLPAIEFAGVVWAGGESDAALAATLHETRDEPELVRLGGMRAFDVRRWNGEFNWKLGVNAFLETYHFKVAHKTGIAPHFVWNRLLIDRLGEHLRLALPRTSFLGQLELPVERCELRPHVSYVYFVFPCSFISILPDHASFITFLPDGPSRTQVETHLIVPAGSPDDGRRDYWEKNAALFAQTVREDLALAASIQKGIDAEPTDTFTFARFEHGIARFREVLGRLVEG